MTFTDTICYRPYVKSIVTENPWIISCYSFDKVWIIRNGEWRNASHQTFGASIEFIMNDILGVQTSIPLIVLKGKKGIEEHRKNVSKNYFKY